MTEDIVVLVKYLAAPLMYEIKSISQQRDINIVCVVPSFYCDLVISLTDSLKTLAGKHVLYTEMPKPIIIILAWRFFQNILRQFENIFNKLRHNLFVFMCLN